LFPLKAYLYCLPWFPLTALILIGSLYLLYKVSIKSHTHQQIYSFRYAIDAMKRFPFDDKRDLTMSFRFGKKIADLASMFIREAKDEKNFWIKGNPEKSSNVAFYTELPNPKAGKRCAILSRTNLALFEKALGFRSRGIPFSLEGNIGAILGRILDVFWLSTDEHDRIRDPFIHSFESLDSLDTSHGEGTITEVDGNKYLVDLDWQSARLWEKGWGLKRA
jgi:F-box protein 18 (helicase)